MIIVWGTRIDRRRLGFVADFCAICRDARPFVAVDVRRVSHLYYVPLGSGQPVLCELTCAECGTIRAVNPGRFTRFERGPCGSIEELTARTRSDADLRLAQRLEIEESVRGGRVDDDMRGELLAEPIATLHYMIESRLSKDTSQSVSAVIQLAMMVALLSTGVALAAGAAWPISAALVLASAALVATVIYRSVTRRASLGRRLASERVVRSLRPLRPTRAELLRVVEDLAQIGLPVGTWLDPDDIERRLATQAA
jgi:hypothetical protein